MSNRIELSGFSSQLTFILKNKFTLTMIKTIKYLNLVAVICFLLSSCVTIEKSKCDSSKKGNKKKMKKLRSGGGFNMGAVIKPINDQAF